jgi:hypothetical protein
MLRAIQYYFFFLIGAGLGAPLAWRALKLAESAEQGWADGSTRGVVVVVAGALVGGALVLLLRRYIVAVVAALIGSAMIAEGLPYENKLMIAAPCFAVSVVIQTGLIRRFIPEKGVEEPPKSS